MSKIKNCILCCAVMLSLPTMLYADNLAVVGQAFLLFIGIITLLSLGAAVIVAFVMVKSGKRNKEFPEAVPRPAAGAGERGTAAAEVSFLILSGISGFMWGVFSGFSLHLYLGEAGGYLFAAVFSGAGAVAFFLLGRIGVKHYGVFNSFPVLAHGTVAAVSAGIIAESLGIISITISLSFLAGAAAGYALTVLFGPGRSFTSLVSGITASVIVFSGLLLVSAGIYSTATAVVSSFIIAYAAGIFLLKYTDWKKFLACLLLSPVSGLLGSAIAVTSGSDVYSAFFLYAISGYAAAVLTLPAVRGIRLKPLHYVVAVILFTAGALAGGISGELFGLTEVLSSAIGGFAFYGAGLYALRRFARVDR